MRARRLIALFVLSFMLAACGGEAQLGGVSPSSGASPLGGRFDRQALLANITDSLILPGHESLADALRNLEAAARAFAAHPDAGTLEATQKAWLNANLARMGVLTYRLGPVDDSLLHNRLDNRPPRTTFIDSDILAGTTPLDAAYIDSIGSSSVGLGAIEYLLFDPVGGDAAVMAAFSGDGGARRRELLVALAAAMPPQAEELRRIWAADGANYAAAFVAADMDAGELQGSLNMLTNQLIADVEDIVNSRLGMPLGKRTSGAPRPDLVEAPYSGASLPRIIATLRGQRAAFTGGDGLGLDDYLDFLGARGDNGLLSKAITAQFDAAVAALEAIDGPLETAIIDDAAGVEAAYQEVFNLLVLLKADMVNQIGLTLTFNDSDGD